MHTASFDFDRLRPARSTLLYGGLLLNTELLAVLAYLTVFDVTLTAPRYTLYGLLWVNVGLWVLARTEVPSASSGTRRRALAIATGYFLVLAYVGGMVRTGTPADAGGLQIVWLPPGWGPAVLFESSMVNLLLMPARVVGYLALAYLVFATVIDAAGAAVSGLLGLLSCVSCSWPVLASLATAILGGGSALAATALSFTYDLSTLVFLVTVALLSWRPYLR